METPSEVLSRVKDEVARESEDYNNWFEVVQAKEQYLFVDQVARRFHKEMQKQKPEPATVPSAEFYIQETVKRINNSLKNWGTGYTAEVMQSYASLCIEEERKRWEAERRIKIKVYKNDDMDAFGAYLSPSIKVDKHGVVLFNVEASLEVCVENEISFKEILVETTMHEVGHALEEFYNLEFSEDRVERMIASYIEKYKPLSHGK